MLTLTTPAKLDIEVLSATRDRNARYSIDLNGQTIFEGKIFVEKVADTTATPTVTKNINITDILRNYKYDGAGLIEPIWLNEIFTFPQLIAQQPIPYYVSKVTIRVEGEVSGQYNVLVQDFYTTPRFEADRVYEKERLLLGDVTKAIPIVPDVDTINYYVGAALHSDAPEVDINGHIAPKPFNGLDSVVTVPLSIIRGYRSDGIYVNDTYKIADYDKCTKDYYLCWQVGASWFSYGFEGLAEATRAYERVEIMDIDDNTNRSQTKITKGWKLNSGFIGKDYQEAFDWLFKSKWVGIYEVATDTFRYVNVKNANFTWKANMREMKNVEVEVEERAKYIG